MKIHLPSIICNCCSCILVKVILWFGVEIFLSYVNQDLLQRKNITTVTLFFFGDSKILVPRFVLCVPVFCLILIIFLRGIANKRDVVALPYWHSHKLIPKIVSLFEIQKSHIIVKKYFSLSFIEHCREDGWWRESESPRLCEKQYTWWEEWRFLYWYLCRLDDRFGFNLVEDEMT